MGNNSVSPFMVPRYLMGQKSQTPINPKDEAFAHQLGTNMRPGIFTGCCLKVVGMARYLLRIETT